MHKLSRSRRRSCARPTVLALALALAPTLAQAKRPKAKGSSQDNTVSVIIDVGPRNKPKVQAVVSVPINGEVSGRVSGWQIDGHAVICKAEVRRVNHPNAPDTVRAEVSCKHSLRPDGRVFQMRGELPLRAASSVVLGAVGAAGGEAVRVTLRRP